MRLAIAERRLQTPGRSESLLEGSAKAEPAIYAPPSYPASAELPPAIHPPGKVVLPDDQFVSRVVDEVSSGARPERLEVNGVKYERRASGKDVALDYGAVGSPFRLLLGARRPIRVVMRCSDQDPALAPCHERSSPEARERYKEAMKCDLDGDRRLTASQELDCLDAQQKRKAAEKLVPAKNAP